MLNKLSRGVPAFAIIGGIGFIVDAACLMLLISGFGWGKYTARLASFGVAVTVTWFLNRTWTFAETVTPNKKREYTRYIAVQTIGVLLNFAVYGVCIETSVTMSDYPVLALAVGSIVAMFFNYAGSKRFVFNHRAES
ncbi:MAG: GtrA family protein [Gammaproteobacteria bacterium]